MTAPGQTTPIALSTIGGGINRLRTKALADKTSLYDLLNGYVTQSNTVKVRPGTFRNADIATYSGAGATKGLLSYQGQFHVFATSVVSVPPGYTVHVLSDPNSLGTPIALKEIHFAAPYLGGIYVVAEFVNGDVFHYWIQASQSEDDGNEWSALTDYQIGDVVIPTSPNGYQYVASRRYPANPTWTANTLEEEGNIVEPTTANGFLYVCTSAVGSNPSTGATEPTWPTSDGSTVVESSTLANDQTVTLATAADATPTVKQVAARYAGLYPT